MRVFRAQQLPAATGRPRAYAPARQGSLEPFLTPDPLHSLVIDAPAIKSQPGWSSGTLACFIQPNLLSLHDRVLELSVLPGLWPHSCRQQFYFSGVPIYAWASYLLFCIMSPLHLFDCLAEAFQSADYGKSFCSTSFRYCNAMRPFRN